MLVPTGNGYGPSDPQTKALPLGEQTRDAAARWVCAQAGRGLDLANPVARRQAVGNARLVLDVLGLHGDDAWRPSPTAARYVGMPKSLHGTREGVANHQQRRTRLCGPCLRWQEVDARKHAGIVFMRPPLAGLIGLCGTHRRWQGHLADQEAMDPACALYAEWFTAQLHRRDYTGPLAQHVIDDPCPLHLDGTACGHRVDRYGNGTEAGCTGRAGWLLSCTCSWEQPVATLLGCSQLGGEHRRQVILRVISETN